MLNEVNSGKERIDEAVEMFSSPKFGPHISVQVLLMHEGLPMSIHAMLQSLLNLPDESKRAGIEREIARQKRMFKSHIGIEYLPPDEYREIIRRLWQKE